MLFSYIVGHVHVNSRKKLKMRNLLRKYKSGGFFYTPFMLVSRIATANDFYGLT